MRYLWFNENATGSVTMQMRGSPRDWPEHVQANTLTAIIDLMQDLMVELEVTETDEHSPGAENVVQFKPKH